MKQTLLSVFRTLIAAIGGAFLLGKNVFGIMLDSSLMEQILGAFMAIVSLVWGILDKSLKEDAIISFVKQIVSITGGVLVASGKISDSLFEMIMGVLTSILALFGSSTARVKDKKIVNGDIQLNSLKIK